jgi:hypothetical protein
MITPDPEFLRCMECVVNGIPYETKDNTPTGIGELIDLVVDTEDSCLLNNEESELDNFLDWIKVDKTSRSKDDLLYGSSD